MNDAERQAMVDQQNRIVRGLHRAAVGLCLVGYLASVVFLAVLLVGCSAHRAPDLRPAPPARIQAHLSHFPPLPISGQLVTLIGYLEDLGSLVRCPSETWLWSNGTESSHTSDCDPSEEKTRHYAEIKRGRLGPGEHRIRLTFGFEGHQWSVDDVVPVQ